MQILLVEDDRRLAQALAGALRRNGFEVEHRLCVDDALAPTRCDLVLLDLGLPDGDGIELCRELRRTSDVGIIILTARGEEQTRVAGLRAGADDYVLKPFNFPELHARIDSVLRRRRPQPAGAYRIGGLVVDVPRHLALAQGTPLALTRMEFQLLAALASDPEVVHPRERLIREVWRTSWLGSSRTVDVHIAALRAKLASAGVLVQTVRGVGYRLVAAGDGGVPAREA